MSVGRHMCRVALVKSIFAKQFRDQEADVVIEMTLENMRPTDEDRAYINETLKGVFDKLEDIKKKVAEYASERPVDDINLINRAILYLGAYEIMFGDPQEVPPIVAINEAIEVARELSDDSGIAFVNGVLNKIYNEKIKNE